MPISDRISDVWSSYLARHRSDQRGWDGQRIGPSDESQVPVFAGSINWHNRGFCATFPHCPMPRSREVKKGFTATYKYAQPKRLFRGKPVGGIRPAAPRATRSEEHTSALQSLMRNSYAVFCLNKKKLLHHTNHRTKLSPALTTQH